ncbi:hypothetical protein PFLUV_G00020040 [Perca fluviatilis]|uniref:Uncharacterized protein n=1 Tax=Perca fluviatilis TaxID=8168 RepID=A0A6A5FR71_PERFL|nr:hypothetical protein PFLUV_G00020040 [Perca fluviatilis]
MNFDAHIAPVLPPGTTGLFHGLELLCRAALLNLLWMLAGRQAYALITLGFDVFSVYWSGGRKPDSLHMYH